MKIIRTVGETFPEGKNAWGSCELWAIIKIIPSSSNLKLETLFLISTEYPHVKSS